MRCATLSPLDLTHVTLAVETARAGGIALLDAVHAVDERIERCVANARELVTAVPHTASVVGVRLTAAQIDTHRAILDAFASRPHLVVLVDWRDAGAAPLIDRLHRQGREIWLEAGSHVDLTAVDASLPFS